ncbi:hypothetical protein, partial [Mycoplasmopsis arginini]|uniref:hypothetical protein n=1 Tax=Mycoplasmopsis arginini TaxID=2094 RepID=UPI00249EFD14
MADAGSAIGGAVSVIGGVSSSKASKSAAKSQEAAAEAGIQEQSRQYDLSRADLAPYRAAGTESLNKLSDLLGIQTYNPEYQSAKKAYDDAVSYRASLPNFGETSSSKKSKILAWAEGDRRVATAKSALDALEGNKYAAKTAETGSLLKKFDQNDLNNDVVYQNGLKFGLDQGIGAIESRARASGSSDSGSVLKALAKYSNDYGTTKANESYNRYTNDNTNIYNKLSGVAGTGQNAVNTGVAAGANSANQIADLTTQGGNARAAGIVGSS